jgi:aryl sulfotransferase
VEDRLPDLAVYADVTYDSRRWAALPLRADDIVISAPVKSGTSWLQTICSLLLFQDGDLPARLGTMSPWLESNDSPVEEIVSALEAQKHRRVIKSHTPIDGIPVVPGMTVVAGVRHPLDAGVSWYHHLRNVDFPALMTRLGLPPSYDPSPTGSAHDYLTSWIAENDPAAPEQSTLTSQLRMIRTAWERRNDPGVVLVHYADLSADLEREMRRIAERLGIEVPQRRWPALIEAASFERMAERADELVPSQPLKSSQAFFRGGRSGDGASLLSDDELAQYHDRARAELPAELYTWLHRP